MFRFIFFGLVLTVNGAPQINRLAPQINRLSHLDGRIVGGKSTTIEKYPFQVSVHNYGFFICGGSIISPKFVITAGHCSYDIPDDSLSVRAASNTTDQNGQDIPIKQSYLHPQFDDDLIDYDICILELYYTLKLGQSAIPIALAPADFKPSPGTLVTVTGWGTLSENDDRLPYHLQVVEVPLVSNEECQEDYGDEAVITERMICAGTKEGGKDACQGDSGGPLIVDGVLAGIVSWGFGCARAEYPGVYSRISEFRDFIKNVTLV